MREEPDGRSSSQSVWTIREKKKIFWKAKLEKKKRDWPAGHELHTSSFTRAIVVSGSNAMVRLCPETSKKVSHVLGVAGIDDDVHWVGEEGGEAWAGGVGDAGLGGGKLGGDEEDRGVRRGWADRVSGGGDGSSSTPELGWGWEGGGGDSVGGGASPVVVVIAVVVGACAVAVAVFDGACRSWSIVRKSRVGVLLSMLGF
jgi:hypothetical protein